MDRPRARRPRARRPGRARLGLLAAVPALGLCAVAAWALGRDDGAPRAHAAAAGEMGSCEELSPAARRGKQIYQRGATEDGRPIEGAIVGGAAALSGREAACAGCHGPSGQGTTEGGVTAPPLAAERRLASSGERGGGAGQGRRPDEGAMSAAALVTAIREGRGPAGQWLSPVMPRYRLEEADLSDLVEYLGCVGRDLDPGVTAGSVALGAALPLTGPDAPVGAAARDVLMAAFADVNAQGGIYRRRIELRVEDSAGPSGEAGATARLLDRGVLALVGSAFDGDPALRARLSEERAALVGPLALAGAPGLPGGAAAPGLADGAPAAAAPGLASGAPAAAAPGLAGDAPRRARDVAGGGAAGADDLVFQVLPGPDVLARVAVKHLAGAPANAASLALVVHTRDRAGEAWASGARAEAAHRDLPAPPALSFEPGRLSPRDVAGAVRAHGARAVLFWGPGADLASARAALDDVGSAAPIYASLGSLAGSAGAPSRGLAGRVLFLYPGSLGERERASEDALHAFLRRAGVAPGPLWVQASAYVAAQIAIEALKRAGAHATREGLIAALEQLRDFDAGPAPPVTFARNRRTGVLGASVFRMDPASDAPAPVRASVWIEVVP
ncbi:cytochrome c/ABC transporter substrate-binding protein [Sorangium sp. So ce124]|uniref:cytochrome c/ABC transporter substrate-binding protein n=1 Tax=Sorangium sp. So ce124 TaxID=3133280 RepID=UPI003F634828